MTKKQPKPMSREDVSRIMSAEAKKNGGAIKSGSLGSRSDALVQRREAAEKQFGQEKS